MKAAKLIMLTDVEGLYADFDDKDSLISEMDSNQARVMIESDKPRMMLAWQRALNAFS